MPRWQRPTIMAVLLVPMLALLIVSGGSLFLMQWFAARDAVDELADRLAQSGLNLLEDELKDRLEPATSLVTYVASEIETRAYAIEGDERLGPFLTGTLAAAPQVAGVAVMDTGLKGVRVLRQEGRPPEPPERTDFSANPAARSAMELMRDRRDIYWGRLLDSEALKATSVNAVMPIRRGADIIGMTVALVSINELSRLAEDIGRQQGATVFVLHGQDRVIAHPLMLKTHLPPAQAGRAWLLASFPDTALKSFVEARGKGGSEWPGETPPQGLTTFTHDGEGYFAISRAIEGFGDEPLIVGAYRKAAEVDRPFELLYYAGLGGLGILALGGLGTVLLSRAISSPLRRTSQAAEAIGKLEVASIAPMKGSAIRELEDLSRAFNRMLDGLHAFGRYVPKALVEKLIEEGRVGAGTEERTMTVMFTDIRGFSTISEKLSPQEVAAFVNRHLSLVAECIEAEGGTIDKFIGDAVMAFWGAPERLADTASPACRAALAIGEAIAADNAARKAQARAAIGLRIGIHTGPLIVGDIGTPSRINYTVVGDVVNTAQRLEALGKEVDPGAETIVLLSRETREKLSGELFTTWVGELAVKGRQEKVEVYRLQ